MTQQPNRTQPSTVRYPVSGNGTPGNHSSLSPPERPPHNGVQMPVIQSTFRPVPLIKGPHFQTFLAWVMKGGPGLQNTQVIKVPLDAANQTTIHLNEPELPHDQSPTVILLHGLEGDAVRPYMVRTARKAQALGFRTVRMNMRCCGDAEGLSNRFYNGAQSDDIAAVARWIRSQHPHSPVFLIGFSLGGNMVLKAAGEGRIEGFGGVASVCPPLQPHASVLAMRHWKNRLYELNFVRNMVRRVERHHSHFSLSLPNPLHPKMPLADFDAAFTVPHGGFENLDHYYTDCCAIPLLSQIKQPWLIITAQDDPLIPFESFKFLEGSSHLLAPKKGGHIGFIGLRETGDPDSRWAENRALEFLAKVQAATG